VTTSVFDADKMDMMEVLGEGGGFVPHADDTGPRGGPDGSDDTDERLFVIFGTVDPFGRGDTVRKVEVPSPCQGWMPALNETATSGWIPGPQGLVVETGAPVVRVSGWIPAPGWTPPVGSRDPNSKAWAPGIQRSEPSPIQLVTKLPIHYHLCCPTSEPVASCSGVHRHAGDHGCAHLHYSVEEHMHLHLFIHETPGMEEAANDEAVASRIDTQRFIRLAFDANGRHVDISPIHTHAGSYALPS
jgi:hypothetical protein